MIWTHLRRLVNIMMYRKTKEFVSEMMEKVKSEEFSQRELMQDLETARQDPDYQVYGDSPYGVRE